MRINLINSVADPDTENRKRKFSYRQKESFLMRWNTFPEMENFEFANRIYFTFTCLTSYHMSLCCAVIGRYTELSLIEYVGMADEGNETVLWRRGPGEALTMAVIVEGKLKKNNIILFFSFYFEYKPINNKYLIQ